MSDAIEIFRHKAVLAVQNEAAARLLIGSAMAEYLGSPVAVTVSDFRRAGGFAFASWTSADRKLGLMIRQDGHGLHIAVDVGLGVEIGRGDGLSGLAPLVLQHFKSICSSR